jgi:type VII secretion integral membrane protein EccD
LAAVPLLFAGGAMIVPPAYGHPGPFQAANIAAGSVLVAVAAATLLRLTRLGIATLTAVTVLAFGLTVAAVLSTYLDLSTGQVATGAIVAGLVLLAVSPRLAVLVARIRPPDLPDPGDEVSPATLADIFDAEADAAAAADQAGEGPERAERTIESRARLAVTTLIGLIIAVSLTIPAAATTTAATHPGGLREVVLVVAVAAILTLRARSYPDRAQATALLTAAVLTVVGLAFVLIDAYHSPQARLLVALAVAATMIAGAWAAVRLPGVRLSPVTRRVIDLIEYGLIVLVPILAFWSMGIYTAMRRI